ncbi:hypothetical protein MBLNU13_g06569t2 [Cladosporium sp. NU13]
MATLKAKPCANCSTPSTTAHPLKRCGKCKDNKCCNKLCQKANCSFVYKEMPPTRELPLGDRDGLIFTSGWLASIAHLLKREQGKTKAELATKKFEVEEAKMTPEMREADRLETEAFGAIQQKVNARLAVKDAAKDASDDFEMNETDRLPTFAVQHSAINRTHAIPKAQKAADTHSTTTRLTSSPSDTQKIIPTFIIIHHQPNPENSTSWLLLHAPTATPQAPVAMNSSSAVPAKLSPTATETVGKPTGKLMSHPVATQKAKKAKSQACLKKIQDMLEESLLPNGQLKFGENIIISHDSFLKNTRPVSELPLGYQKMIAFPPK